MFSFEQSSTSPFGQTNSVFWETNSLFGPNNSSNNPFSPKPFGSTTPFGLQTDSSISGGTSTGAFGGSSGFGQKPAFEGIGIPTSIRKQVEAAWKRVEAIRKQHLEAVRKEQLEAVGTTSTPPAIGATRTSAIRRMSDISIPASFGSTSNDVFSIFSTITEEDDGTSGQTAKLGSISAMPAYKYERFESCFAIAGADYCVIAADFSGDHTKISKLSEKSVMTSCGFQAGVKALQEDLSAENLIYERQHNKPMSCPETLRSFCHFRNCHPDYVFILLGGLDSEGKGWIFTNYGFRANVYYGHRAVASPVGYSSQDSESRLIVPPIYKYKLPAEDVLARLSETEAVDLAKTVFASATQTGDKLEIVVLNASGLRREYKDLRKDCDRRWDKLEVIVPTATGVHCDRCYGQVFSRERKKRSSSVPLRRGYC